MMKGGKLTYDRTGKTARIAGFRKGVDETAPERVQPGER